MVCLRIDERGKERDSRDYDQREKERKQKRKREPYPPWRSLALLTTISFGNQMNSAVSSRKLILINVYSDLLLSLKCKEYGGAHNPKETQKEKSRSFMDNPCVDQLFKGELIKCVYAYYVIF